MENQMSPRSQWAVFGEKLTSVKDAWSCSAYSCRMKTPNHRITLSPTAAVAPSRDAIERLAYDLWQRKGCPIGRSLECWLEAEKALASRTQRPSNVRRRGLNHEVEEFEEQLDELLPNSGAPTDPRSPTSL